MTTAIFMPLAAYAEHDLPRTIESAIGAASGRIALHISVCEQVTRYADAYAVGRWLPDYVRLDIRLVGDRLIGLGGARQLAEERYNGEDYQVQVDAHTRFEADWDVAAVKMLERLGPDAIVTGGQWPEPWTDADKVPVARFDRMENGIPTGNVEMVEPNGPLDSALPARTVLGHSIMGASWCVEVPADPHILFAGEEPALAARLWTHGRTLWHARVPWSTAMPGKARPANRPWERAEWGERDAISQRRVQSLLTGATLDHDDPAGLELDRYGLGPKGLAAWTEYSGLDYVAGTVRTPWPAEEVAYTGD